WARCAAGPMTEGDVAAVLKELAGRAFTREIAAWVHGTKDLPLEDLLRTQGIAVVQEPAQWQQRLGIRASEPGGSVVLKNVPRGGPAEAAGMAANDEWIGVEVAGHGWRLAKVDDLPLYAGDQRKVTALVARDRRLLR